MEKPQEKKSLDKRKKKRNIKKRLSAAENSCLLKRSNRNLRLTSKELDKLRKVFVHISNYIPLMKIYAEIVKRSRRLKQIRNNKKYIKANRLRELETTHFTPEEDKTPLEIEYNKLAAEVEELDIQVQRESKVDKAIEADDIKAALNQLGYMATLADAQDIIWEVDLDCDDQTNWKEFYTMYIDNINHTSPVTKPAGFTFFNLVCFIMYDEDRSGTIGMDETISLLYARYGKRVANECVDVLFGPNGSKIKQEFREINFSQFLEFQNMLYTKGELRSKFVDFQKKYRILSRSTESKQQS